MPKKQREICFSQNRIKILKKIEFNGIKTMQPQNNPTISKLKEQLCFQ